MTCLERIELDRVRRAERNERAIITPAQHGQILEFMYQKRITYQLMHEAFGIPISTLYKYIAQGQPVPVKTRNKIFKFCGVKV